MPDTTTDDLKGLQKEALDRLKDCEAQKAQVELDLREGYFFSAPWRSRQLSSKTSPLNDKTDDTEEEPATSLGMEASADFAGIITSTFMPSNFDWARRGQGAFLSEEDWGAVKDEAEKGDKQIMNAIRASNLEANAFQVFAPDLSLGTAAVWIDDPTPAMPAAAKAIPLRELEINIGPDGRIDDRFVVKHVKPRNLKANLPGIAGLDDLAKAKANQTKGKRLRVAQGFWRKWEDVGSVRWQHVILVDDKLVHDEEMTGEGSIPLLVMRFFPDASRPFGNGPMLQAKPWLRILDALSGCTQDRADIAIAPPIGYPNDGVVNFEGGIQSGMAYPMAPGSGRDFVPLYFQGDPNLGLITLAELEASIKRLFYIDRPEQRGKTPPTAFQFLDELMEAQRRIGPPGQGFWLEGPLEIFLRFKFMQERAGLVAPLTSDGRLVSVTPFNPAVASAEAQEVQQATRFVELARALFPAESQAAIDGFTTLENIKKKMREELVVMRASDESKRLIEGLLNAAGGAGAQQGGAPNGP